MTRRILRAIAFVCTLLVPEAAPGTTREIRLPTGRGVVEWITPSSFRVCREWEDGPRCQTGRETGQNFVSHAETSELITFNTHYLRVEVVKRDWAVRVTTRDGATIFEDLEGPVRVSNGLFARRKAELKERFYGLAARTQHGVNLRGQLIETGWPLLISSRGYGVYHPRQGRYLFDMAASTSGEWRVTALDASVFEYWFYYGPTPKEILEEHKEVMAPPRALRRWQLGVLQPGQEPPGTWRLPSAPSWEGLRESIRALAQGSLSGKLVPVLDLSAYTGAPSALLRRAVALGSVVPVVASSLPTPDAEEMADALGGLLRVRARWAAFLLSYIDEVSGRGLPVVRPLAMQFPADEEAANIDDEFMIGDEVLAAPVYSSEGCRSVYLPMGIWTEWHTNRLQQGRNRVEVCVRDEEVPLYMKNGSLVPLVSEEGGVMEVHYFPKLAAEFFLVESELNDYTQIHAAPALDTLRLEVESKVSRSYEWVVHHVGAVRQVRDAAGAFVQGSGAQRLRDREWIQEGANLRVRVRVPAGKTEVVYVTF